MGKHDEHQMRRFIAARNAGDEVQMRLWWEQLLTANVGRVRGMVFVQTRGHVFSEADRQEAVQASLIKIANNMFVTFKGSSVGEWVNSVETLVFGVCVDVQRKAERISKREQPLTYGDTDEATTNRQDAAMYRHYQDEQSWQDSVEQEEGLLAMGRDFLAWAIPRLPPAQRAVIELDLQGIPVTEIQARLDVSRDVVYQSRRRGLARLATLLSEYPR